MEPIFIDKEKQHSIGYVSFDYIVRYGCLGYGYSHQLQQPEMSVAALVKESLLLRCKFYWQRAKHKNASDTAVGGTEQRRIT